MGTAYYINFPTGNVCKQCTLLGCVIFVSNKIRSDLNQIALKSKNVKRHQVRRMILSKIPKTKKYHKQMKIKKSCKEASNEEKIECRL